MKTKFRKVRKYEDVAVRLSPTDVSKCPLILLRKKTESGYKFKPTPRLEEIFEKGSHIHQLEGIFRDNARFLVDTEKHMVVIHENGKYIFSGYADFIRVDQNGLYIEDLKTCDIKAFYHFFTDGAGWNEIIQVSAYRWLYFVIYGVLIERGTITKIDRENTLNRISMEIPLMDPEEFELFLEGHPVVQKIVYDNDNMVDFNERSKDIIKKNRWMCRYCGDSKDCQLHKELKLEEKIAKDKAKKNKIKFKELIKNE